eukprot:356886-Chlamydomonas_euryale.AAC.4
MGVDVCFASAPRARLQSVSALLPVPASSHEPSGVNRKHVTGGPHTQRSCAAASLRPSSSPLQVRAVGVGADGVQAGEGHGMGADSGRCVRMHYGMKSLPLSFLSLASRLYSCSRSVPLRLTHLCPHVFLTQPHVFLCLALSSVVCTCQSREKGVAECWVST